MKFPEFEGCPEEYNNQMKWELRDREKSYKGQSDGDE